MSIYFSIVRGIYKNIYLLKYFTARFIFIYILVYKICKIPSITFFLIACTLPPLPHSPGLREKYQFFLRPRFYPKMPDTRNHFISQPDVGVRKLLNALQFQHAQLMKLFLSNDRFSVNKRSSPYFICISMSAKSCLSLSLKS